uniref:Glycosyltransferase family 92 protein n=1 Tax=Caenorhabditis tropicalis TaxID=1561998 RepID=A0A1I7SZP2_9PELO
MRALLCRRPKKITVLVFLVLFLVWLFITIIEFSFGLTVTTDDLISPMKIVKARELKAFITSAYYYPTSKSLGNNALALVLSINLVKPPTSQLFSPDPTELVIMAKNETSSVQVSTPFLRYISFMSKVKNQKNDRVTPHEVCQIITVFATAQLLPNVKSIHMVGNNGMSEIPFTIPSYSKRDVVVCTSPLFVSEQWQNFLFAVHVYRRFGAHMNLYLISAVTSFYELMKEYEREGYLKIQPWVKVDFPGVSRTIADPHNQIEFRNQAASQTDCLLQFKESARFITFLDLDDVLIPKLAPTYAEEFQKLMEGKNKLAYIFYHKENYDAITTRNSSKFSLKKMFSSLECKHKRETGKIVVDPRNLNYTWIHFPPILPNGLEKYEVTENVITHLKTIIWSDKQDPSSRILIEPPYFDNSSAKIISSRGIMDIEDDLRKMIRKPRIRKIFPDLPSTHYYTDLVVKCYNDRYYRYHYSGRIGEIKCPGPQLCGFHQHPKIKCTHVDATHKPMKTLHPITYYYATNPRFTGDIGCYSH